MVSLFFLLFWCVFVVDSSALFFPDGNGFYKSITLPIPGGNNPSLAESIAYGTQMAMEYCEMDFKWDRWNCPSSTFSRQSKRLPTRETAYVNAISAAGIVHAITKSCSAGNIEGCGCDPNAENPSTITSKILVDLKTDKLTADMRQAVDWSWGGCSDYPKFALNTAKTLLDGSVKGTNAAANVARHNNLVGRQIVRNTMVTKCRCHGISSSCSLQTCWMQLASFGEISSKLKEKYKRAIRVPYEMMENPAIIENSAREVAQKKRIPVNSKSLIFLESSPDYCTENFAEDFPGTKGRACSKNNSSISEKKSCRNLCRSCGHRIKRVKREVTKQCNCRFSWCCKVICETCVNVEDNYFSETDVRKDDGEDSEEYSIAKNYSFYRILNN